MKSTHALAMGSLLLLVFFSTPCPATEVSAEMTKDQTHSDQTKNSSHIGNEQIENTNDRSNNSHRPFANPEEHAARFDDPTRDDWQKPEQVLDFVKIKSTDKFADFGAGTGYFTMRAAARVKEGEIIAIDSEPSMLQYIRKRAQEAGLSNVKTLQIDHDGFLFPGKVDVILMVNTYHHLKDRVSRFRELVNCLRDDGKLVIIEGKEGTPMEPPPELRVSAEIITRELSHAGYALADEAFFLPFQTLQVFKVKRP